jgi:hypothetical protein
VAGDEDSFAVKAEGESLAVSNGAGTVLLTMPVSVGGTDVDMVVDADILEITLTGTEGIASTRIPVLGSGDIRISPRGESSVAGARLSTP